MTKQFKIIPAL